MNDPAIAAEIERDLPECQVAPIFPGKPAANPHGRNWCFVEWLLRDMSGLEACRQLRAWPETSDSHITMILEDDDPASRRRALNAGADDYMPGPATGAALVERMRRYLTDLPVEQASPAARTVSGLTLDPEAHQVRWQGKLVALRPREVALLEAFLDHPDRLLTRSRLIALAGKECEIADERTVDVWVGRLRRSLEAQGVPRIVRTVRSHGYVFDTPDLRP